MILLENIENGYLYSNILLKLYLRSLKNEGKLEYNEKIPYNSQMISKLVRHNVDVVESAIDKFIQLGLIDKYEIRDLWQHKIIGKGNKWKGTVQVHETKLFRLKKI